MPTPAPDELAYVQSRAYAGHFESYRQLLGRLLRFDLARFEIPLDAAIADVGCGFGDDIRTLHAMGYKSVVGVEPDPACVAKRGDLDIRRGTLENTGLETSSCDAVLVNNVFHHVPDYAAALDEVVRVLRPGGVLCMIEPRNSRLRRAMDAATFGTPLPRISRSVKMRYDVMREEFETGLYPQWLRSHSEFFALLHSKFDVDWIRQTTFFFVVRAERSVS